MSTTSTLTIERLRQMLSRCCVYRDAVELELPITLGIFLLGLLSILAFALALGCWFSNASPFAPPSAGTPWVTIAPLLLLCFASGFRAIVQRDTQIEAFAALKAKLLQEAAQEIASIEQRYPKALFMAALPYRDLLEPSNRETPDTGDRYRLCELLRDYDRLLKTPINYLRAVNYLDSLTSQERARIQRAAHFDSIATGNRSPSAG